MKIADGMLFAAENDLGAFVDGVADDRDDAIELLRVDQGSLVRKKHKTLSLVILAFANDNAMQDCRG